MGGLLERCYFVEMGLFRDFRRTSQVLRTLNRRWEDFKLVRNSFAERSLETFIERLGSWSLDYSVCWREEGSSRAEGKFQNMFVERLISDRQDLDPFDIQ